jgi:hypothetical protein
MDFKNIYESICHSLSFCHGSLGFYSSIFSLIWRPLVLLFLRGVWSWMLRWGIRLVILGRRDERSDRRYICLLCPSAGIEPTQSLSVKCIAILVWKAPHIIILNSAFLISKWHQWMSLFHSHSYMTPSVLFFLHINICLSSFEILGQWIPATVGAKLHILKTWLLHPVVFLK